MNNGRKISGGKYHSNKKKKLYERSGQERHVVLGETKIKTKRVRGANVKTILLKGNFANIIVNGKAKKAEIKNVVETPQNKFFARQNRLMKSAVIDTTLGKARITNRPSQEGCINAVLLENK
jgi:small subunit ribosomal protein S8e